MLTSQPSREKLGSDKTGSAQQMLTPGEISDKRKARRMLEYRKVALEEAVERRVCEGIYTRIFRHKSSLDEIRDEKLRSKTAALSLVGITLKDLGIVFEDESEDAPERKAEIDKWIAKARAGLLDMNDTYYPLGKLKSLAATHQNIVEMLSNLHKSTSSADEILPALIYTLISCPPEGINVISNLCFIQRFRSSSKINGEAAYCLTNLEAAITFLENVDLASLKSEEAIDASSKQATPAASHAQETEFPLHRGSAKAVTPTVTPLTALPSRPDSSSDVRPASPISPSHSRRLSTLFQPSANALGAASDAVRNSADASLKNISQAMDNSFKLLFGRLKEQHVQGPGSTSNGTVLVPKTLDEARRLVSPRPAFDEDGNISEYSSLMEQEDSPREGRLLDMITGKSRDRSADSSGSPGRKFALQQAAPDTASGSPPAVSTPISALDSMRNLGNSLNPLNRFAGVNVMRGFGRSSNTSSPAVTPSPLSGNDTNKELKIGLGLSTSASMPPPPSPHTVKIDPPIQRFVDIVDAGELKLSDVQILLGEYKRLAKAVQERGMC